MTLKEFKKQRDELREVYAQTQAEINRNYIAKIKEAIAAGSPTKEARQLRDDAIALLRELVRKQDDEILNEFYSTRPVLKELGATFRNIADVVNA